MWHKWVSLILPKLHIQAIEVRSWGSLKAFGEVTNTTWAIEGTIRGTLSFFAKFSKKLRDRIQKRRSKRYSQNPFYFSTSEARWKAKSPTGKVRLSFSCANLFKIARRAWSLCACTCRVITSCNSWSAEAEFRLCSRMRKGPSVGEFVDGPYTKYLTFIISRMRGGYNKLHAHFRY
jgi:hypothetical protein